MNRIGMLTVAAVLLIGAEAPTDTVKKELEKLQGEWELVSSDRDGKKVAEKQVKAIRRVVKGEEYTILRDGKVVGKGKIKVDPGKTPRTIEAVRTEGENKEKPMLGIYEWDGDTQKVCFGRPGEDRPKEFTSRAGSGYLLSVWKRVK